MRNGDRRTQRGATEMMEQDAEQGVEGTYISRQCGMDIYELTYIYIHIYCVCAYIYIYGYENASSIRKNI